MADYSSPLRDPAESDIIYKLGEGGLVARQRVNLLTAATPIGNPTVLDRNLLHKK
jgi:hypothetical protein